MVVAAGDMKAESMAVWATKVGGAVAIVDMYYSL
jgi:hypothetical protein